jgi:hypothetical protein
MPLSSTNSMPTVMEDKQQIHELIDKLAPSQLAAVRSLLQGMLDPVSRAIANAPIDDEPEVLADFGLTADDIRNDQASK